MNFRFLLVAFGVLSGIAAAMYTVHKIQTTRMAGALLHRAELLVAEKKPREAAQYLQRYLGFQPQDVAARLLYCQTLEEVARTPRDHVALFFALSDLVRRAPELDAQRRTLCTVALRINRFSDARTHLEDHLLKTAPKDGELLFQLGRCDEADEKYSAAAKQYRAAIANGWKKPETYVRLASLMRARLNEAKDADKQMDLMIVANPKSGEAFLYRSRWRLVLNNSTGAMDDIRQAQSLTPDDVEVQLMAAELIRRQDAADLEPLRKIRKILEGLVSKRLKDPRLYAMLSMLSTRLDQPAESEKWLRSGVEAIPTDFELRMQLVQLLIDQSRYDVAKEQMVLLSQASTTQPVIEGVRNMLEGTILIRQEQWAAARERLLNARTQLISRPELLSRATLLLAACFRQLHDRVSEVEAYRAILKVNPLDTFARAGLAAAQAASGHSDEALEDLKKLNDVPGQIRLMYQYQLGLPQEKRRWVELEQAVAAAIVAAPNDPTFVVMSAQIQNAQGHIPAAVQILNDARTKHPKEARYWVASSELAQSQQDWESSAALLEQAQQAVGDTALLHQGWVAHWANHGGTEAMAALDKLEQGVSRFKPDEQAGILIALAAAYRKLNQPADTMRLWGKVAKLRPNDLETQIRYFGASFESEDKDQMRRAAASLRRIEGRDGPYATFAQAAELLRQAKEQPEKLVEARQLLAQVEKQRPDWSLVWLFKARLDEFNIIKNGEQAIINYRRALDLNDQNPAILHRLVQLQRERQLWADAQKAIRSFTHLPGVWGSADFCSAASEVALRTGDPERARELAKMAVTVDPQSARSQLWLGTLLAESEKTIETTEAEAALRKAIELDPVLDGAWIVLVKLLMGAKRDADAATAVAQAARHLIAGNQALALALCYEAVGDRTKASELVDIGLKAVPRDPAALKTATLFFIRNNQPDKAEGTLRTLLTPEVPALDGDRVSARRLLTLVLARRNYQGFRDSLAELERQSKSGTREDTRAEQLFKARILSSWPYQRERKRAVQLLEDEDRRTPLTLLDAVLLTEQYDAIGEREKADQRWAKMIETTPNDPIVLAAASRHYLRWQQWELADPLLAKLQELKPHELSTVEMTAQAQAMRGMVDEAVKLIDQFITDKGGELDPTARLASAATLLDRLVGAPKLNDAGRETINRAAERVLRLVVADKPEAALSLAAVVARLGRVDEALALCENVGDKAPALQISGRAISILHNTEPTPEQIALVERLLQKSQSDPANAVAAAIQRGDLLMIQKRPEEVITVYRQILKDNPDHIVALNNLAWFLAAQKKQYVEAEKLMERAIDVAGPQPTLVDTRGTIRLMAGRWDDAITDFTGSLREQDSVEVRFRLAAAEWNAGNKAGAKEMLKKVLDEGFDASKKLPPLELEAYSKFLKEFLASATMPN